MLCRYCLLYTSLARQEKELELKEREVSIKEKALEAEVKKTAEMCITDRRMDTSCQTISRGPMSNPAEKSATGNRCLWYSARSIIR